MKYYEVTSLEEYIDLVYTIRKNVKLRYRGQSASKFQLVPSVFRDVVATDDCAGRKMTPEIVNFSNEK